jgi:hypothetical protein
MTPKKQKMGDPFEQIAKTGIIGGKQTPHNSDSQQLESSEIQTSESLAVQNIEPSQVQSAKSPDVQKAKHKGREQQTVYLPPHLTRKLKLYKAMHDREYSDIVADALEEYFNTHQ